MQAAERRRSDQVPAQVAPQQMRRAHSGHATGAVNAENAPEMLQQAVRAHSLQSPEAISSTQQQQVTSNSLQQAGRAHSGHRPATTSVQGSPAVNQRVSPVAHSQHVSPGLMQRQMSHDHLQPMARSHSGRSAHSRPSPTPTPPPLAPCSDSARRAYRFIDNGDAPSSGDDLGFRARRPTVAPLSLHVSPLADQAGGLPGSSHMPGRGLVRDSPAAPLSSASAGELPYADLIPIMGTAGAAPQAARARGYAFIDDSSGDDSVWRPALPRQLPAPRPTSGWVEEPVPEAARVWQDEDGHWHSSSGSGRAALSGDHVSDDPQPHAAGAAPTADPPQRITPGLNMIAASKLAGTCPEGHGCSGTVPKNNCGEA